MVRSFKSYDIELKSWTSREFELPPVCPICHQHGMFEPIHCAHYLSLEHGELAAAIYFCNCCDSFFFTAYSTDNNYEIFTCYPQTIEPAQLSPHIQEISSNFCDVYAQSCKAEQEHLDLIAGMGYRRALEFLCKDYAISYHADEREQIIAMPLMQCIKKYIDHPVAAQLAERAAWLGNDHAHYISKHPDKDLNDLKLVLDMVIKWIDLQLSSQLAIEQIQKA